MTAASEPTGTLQVAMAHATRLLKVDPALAAEQALEILKALPNHPAALVLLATARRRAGDPEAAIEALEPLMRTQAAGPAAWFEYGLALGSLGRGDEAIRALKKTVSLQPDHAQGWRALGDHLLAIGDHEGGDAAYARHIQSSAHHPDVRQAAVAMVRNDVPRAETLLRRPSQAGAHRHGRDSHAGRGRSPLRPQRRRAEAARALSRARAGFRGRAVQLRRAVAPAQRHRAGARGSRAPAVANPRSPAYRNLCAVILSRIGEYERSGRIYEELLNEYPGACQALAELWPRAEDGGRQDDSIHAYRQSIVHDPAFGEAYWSLANLKTFRFDAADLAAMQAQVARPSSMRRTARSSTLLLASLRGLGRSRAFLRALRRGQCAAPRRASVRCGAQFEAHREPQEDVYTRVLQGPRRIRLRCPDPIFIVGMPRAGSTLLEQILSTHSQVEGTTELPEIITMAKDLRAEADSADIQCMPEVLAARSAAELKAMGERYLERTRFHRKTDRQFFIDKMPNNFLHVGMIHAVLPNAKIIDARRHPLGCCFSNFKQYYARGQNFSYSLTDMGRFYRDYVELMAHFDEVLPGRVHRVIYERTVEDTEAEVRRLLAYCGLPFEPGCLRFFENRAPRCVRRAPSRSAVPIYRDGVEQWRHYEPWLDPLKDALGAVLEAYPAVPGWQDRGLAP
jgi:tetratricopeptide (TPR) repeat protein